MGDKLRFARRIGVTVMLKATPERHFQRLVFLRSFGMQAEILAEVQFVAIALFPQVQMENALRKAAFTRYDERLANVAGLTVLPVTEGIRQNYAYYPILVDKEVFGLDRDALAAKLAQHDIFARKYFYPLVSENNGFADDRTVSTPFAKAVSRQILCLPMYAQLTPDEVDLICDIILS